ncbi:CapA family protein [Brevibacillus sp. SYP-B805]|uniref:CapA family protein n=1 Tax=Brevibacillus sp. SYP-B805 TaxID=1578199 RepID=UPI0013EAD811|nr:CapA family protein [Brevibacillus sp. SYP-B805]NGQ95948.1 CapA family protein [Brevibacillus sp. SYP-B805]
MHATRTERLRAERKRKRSRARRWFMGIAGLLLLAGLADALLRSAQDKGNAGSSGPVDTIRPAASGRQEGEEEGAAEPVVRLTFVGDVMMSGNVESLLKAKGYDFPYAYVKTLFQQDDCTIANLETPVTERGTPAPNKEYVYKSPPAAIPPLKAAGMDVVNLANNHSMDQGEEGLLDTFRILEENGIDYVGAGADATRAYQPVMVERNGIKVAFLGFSRVVPNVGWYAGTSKPGVAISYEPTRAAEAIAAARKQADLVVVIAHWGQEKVDYPVDHQKELARAYIHAGADLVVGSHPHVLQGFESYNGKWIAYSLGNFVFTRSSVAKTWETMVLQAACTKRGTCTLKMLPFRAELGQAVPMNKQDGARLIRRVESISTGVRVEPDGSVKEAAH